MRETLFALRKAAARAEAGWLLTEGDSVALRSEAVRVDAVAFEDLVRKGSPDALEAAVALYRGDFLHGFSGQATGFEDWLLTERERLRELAIHTLAHLLTQERAAGHLEVALRIALRLATLDPLQEPVHRTLMRVYAQLGRRGAALRQYQTCCALLRRELRVGPEAETKQLYQDVLRRRPLEGMVAESAPRRSLPRPEAALPGLPGKDIPLIGRAGELARLDQAFTMASEGRGHVVTVIGEARIGKTTLVGVLATNAIARTAGVLTGRCFETASILPFGPWVDAIRGGRIPSCSRSRSGAPAATPRRRRASKSRSGPSARVIPSSWSRPCARFRTARFPWRQQACRWRSASGR